MELELIKILDESIALLDRLRAQLEDDNDVIQHCIQGEVLIYYVRNNIKAMEMLDSIREQLVVSRQEHEAAMFLT